MNPESLFNPSSSTLLESPTISLVQAVLINHNVHYQRLPKQDQAPSKRLLPNSFAFPGSRSEFNHNLYASEALPNTLLVVAYSKPTVQTNIGQAEKDAMLLRMLELNAAEPLAVWKLEERRGSLCPMLEETIMLEGLEHRSRKLLWKGCGMLDVLYKSKASVLTRPLFIHRQEVCQNVKNFLNTSFKNLEESVIPSGRSYHVIVSSDEEPDDSKWKRYPMKIDVTEIVTFRIYFALNEAVRAAIEHFPNAAKLYIARLNTILPVGYFNYTSDFNQIQLILKLHYKTLSPADLAASIQAYYDACKLYYKGALHALNNLHTDVERHDMSISQISDYSVQREYEWIRLDYEGNSAQEELEKQLIQVLSDSSELAPYLLPKPIYRLDRRRVLVKSCRELLPLAECAAQSLNIRNYLCRVVLELFDFLCQIDIFPTLDMLYCLPVSPLQLRIVPGKGLHRGRAKFLQEFSQSGLIVLPSPESTIDVSNFERIKVDWESFEVTLCPKALMKICLRKQDCLLYSIDQSPKKPSFAINYNNYTFQIGKLEPNPNPLQGWTEASPYTEETIESEGTSSPQYYLCERCDYMVWRGNALLSTLRQVAFAIQKLHNMGYCHWFINPLTIRQRADASTEPDTVLVLPALTPAYSTFIYSFIPSEYRHFIAPEVKRHIKEGISVDNLFAADVCSFSKVIIEKLKDTPERVELRALRVVAARGSNTDWQLRPPLSELSAYLAEISLQ